jgi:murein DD-endopeptidase MepM/ murein hydrolase activator NlpD
VSESELINFHFIELKGPIFGPKQQPPATREHRPLSISASAIQKLMAPRESTDLGDPVPGLTPSAIESPEVSATVPPRLTSAALDVAYNLTFPATGADGDMQVAGPDPLAESLPDTGPGEAKEDLEPATPTAIEVAEMAPANPASDVKPESGSEPQPEPESESDFSPGQPLETREQAPGSEVGNDADEATYHHLELHDLINLTAPSPTRQAEAGAEAEAEAEAEQDDAIADPIAMEPVPEHVPDQSEPAGANETDNVLVDVQTTLNSLADMAKSLTQQKLEAVKQRESLERLKSQLCEKERSLAEKDEQLRAVETRLNSETSAIEHAAEENARALAERSAALKALAETVEARDRNTAKVAETLRQEKQRNDELAESLQRRAEALDEREAALNRKEDGLAEKLKQLVSTKERFRKIVKTFNETVQFNNTLNSISSTALDDSQL